MLLIQDFTFRMAHGLTAKYPSMDVLSSLSSGCVTTLSSVVCVEQSAVKQAAGNKLQLLSILRDETRTVKETVIRSLAKCSIKRFQPWLQTISRPTCLHLPPSHTLTCTHTQIRKHILHAYAWVNTRGGYGCHLLAILLKFTHSPCRFPPWCCSRLVYLLRCWRMFSFTPAWLRGLAA